MLQIMVNIGAQWITPFLVGVQPLLEWEPYVIEKFQPVT